MKSFTHRLSLAAGLLVLLAMVGALPTRSDSNRVRFNQQNERGTNKGPARSGVKQLSYRSPGSTHKLLLPAEDAEMGRRMLAPRAERKSKAYGAYSLMEVTEAELSSLDSSTLERARLRDDFNLMMLKPGQID